MGGLLARLFLALLLGHARHGATRYIRRALVGRDTDWTSVCASNHQMPSWVAGNVAHHMGANKRLGTTVYRASRPRLTHKFMYLGSVIS